MFHGVKLSRIPRFREAVSFHGALVQPAHSLHPPGGEKKAILVGRSDLGTRLGAIQGALEWISTKETFTLFSPKSVVTMFIKTYGKLQLVRN